MQHLYRIRNDLDETQGNGGGGSQGLCRVRARGSQALACPPGRCLASPGHAPPSFGKSLYSHSMVAGGLLVMSRTTRLISGTSLVTRVEIRASTSAGSRAQSAVRASSPVTRPSTRGLPVLPPAPCPP